MPFKKRKDGKYVSPSGKVMSEREVRAYYANRRLGGKRGKRNRD